MDIILGATGHVGSNVAKNLMALGEEITVITHNPNKMAEWTSQGAQVACVDVHETNALNEVFNRGQKLFFLNPPADPSLDDAVKEEKMTVYSILEALKNSAITKVVAESTYGAQPGDGIGDLGVLHEMEVGLKELGIPSIIIRAAYYMSNWDNFLESARRDGVITSFYPADFKLPMVAPVDLGKVAANLLTREDDRTGTIYVEGPERYSANDVAQAFSKYLNRPVSVKVLERGEWIPWLLEMGFSLAAAESMATMSEITLEEKYVMPKNPYLGTVTIDEYVKNLVSSFPIPS